MGGGGGGGYLFDLACPQHGDLTFSACQISLRRIRRNLKFKSSASVWVSNPRRERERERERERRERERARERERERERFVSARSFYHSTLYQLVLF